MPGGPYSVHQLKKDSQEGISQVELSVLSLYHTEITQDHEEEEDRSKLMNNRTEQLIQLISKVHSMYSVETTRKGLEACSFLDIWLAKLDGATQA